MDSECGSKSYSSGSYATTESSFTTDQNSEVARGIEEAFKFAVDTVAELTVELEQVDDHLKSVERAVFKPNSLFDQCRHELAQVNSQFSKYEAQANLRCHVYDSIVALEVSLADLDVKIQDLVKGSTVQELFNKSRKQEAGRNKHLKEIYGDGVVLQAEYRENLDRLRTFLDVQEERIDKINNMIRRLWRVTECRQLEHEKLVKEYCTNETFSTCVGFMTGVVITGFGMHALGKYFCRRPASVASILGAGLLALSVQVSPPQLNYARSWGLTPDRRHRYLVPPGP